MSEYYDAAGAHVVIFDVAVKPGQEPAKESTEKKYTQAKSKQCPECRRKKNATPAPHRIVEADDETGVEVVYECADGRIVTDPGGRLYANLRDRDETPDEYEVRCLEAIQKDFASYYQVVEVPRTEDERREYLLDTWNTSAQARVSARTGVAPRNPDACFRYGAACDYWEACTGVVSIEDVTRFKRLKNAHTELAAPERERSNVAGTFEF